jgi:multidrug efflux pump subunit AcrB
MCRHTVSLVLKSLLCSLFLALLISPANAQATRTTHKVPTAPEATMQKKAKSKKGLMRGTTQYDRWQAAIKHADKKAAQHRAANKGVK